MMTTLPSRILWTLAVLGAASLLACGGGSSSGGARDDANNDIANNDPNNGKADDVNNAVNNDAPNNDVNNAPNNDGPMLPTFQRCDQAPLPSGLGTEDWNHFTSELVVAAGDPDHTGQDIITTPGRLTAIEGKFVYGLISKDLEDEVVEVWIDDCSGQYRLMGETVTDSDGRIDFVLRPGEIPPVGSYEVYMRVVGDDSAARSTLRVLPVGTQVVVFDIDATLTTDDMELFQDLADDFFVPISSGDYVPEARDGAHDITHLRHEQGYVIIYLTGRPYWLTRQSRQWLADLGMAPGNLRLTDRNRDILPTNDSVGDYKTGYLALLKDLGLVISGAYGNATTDIYAYNNAQVPQDRTWILGKHGGEGGTQELGEGYTEHLPEAAAEEHPAQPFIPNTAP